MYDYKIICLVHFGKFVHTGAEIKPHATEEFITGDSIMVPDCQF